MSSPGTGAVLGRLALAVLGCVFVGMGLPHFTTRLLLQAGVFPSEAVLSAELITVLALPAVLVWGLAARRVRAFVTVTIVAGIVLGLTADLL